MSRVVVGIAALQFCMLVVGLFRGKALSFIFGPDGLGLIGAYDQLVVLLTQFGAFGLPFAAMKMMSGAHSAGQPIFNGVFSRMLVIMGGLAIAGTGAAILLTTTFPSVFGTELSDDPILLRLAVLGVAPLMMTVFISHTLAASQVPFQTAFFALTTSVLMTAAAIAGSLIDGLRGLYVLTAVTGYSLIIVAVVYLKARRGLRLWPARPLAKPIKQVPNLVLEKTAFSVFCVLVGYAGCLLGARLIVLSELGEFAAGLLQSALAISLSVGSVVAAIINIQLAPALNRNSPVAVKFSTANDALGQVVLLLCLGTVPFILFPQITLRFLYSAEFGGAAVTLILCLAWQAFYQVLTIFQQLLIGVGATLLTALFLVAAFIGSAGAMLVLVPSFGLIGVPIGLLGGTLGSLALHLTYLWKVHDFRPASAMFTRLAIIAGTALTSVFVLDPSDGFTAAKAASFGAAVVAILLSIDKTERVNFWNFVWRLCNISPK